MPPRIPSVENNHSGLLPLVLITLTLSIYDVMLLSNAINLKALDQDLKDKVYLQTDVIETVVQTLGRVNNREKNMNILNLIGPCGVGKTFITRIITNHFHSPIYDQMHGPLSGPKFAKQSNEIIQMIETEKFTNYKMIVIDDLSVGDLNNLLDFIQKLPRDNSITVVINILNIQETDDDIYVNQFDSTNIPYENAIFHQFTPSQAKNWAETRMIAMGMNPETHSNILDDVLANHDLRRYGFKGLEAKIRVKM